MFLLCCRDAIVAWIGKKLGPAVQNLTAVDEAEKIVTGDDVAVLAFLDHLSVCNAPSPVAAKSNKPKIGSVANHVTHIDPKLVELQTM